MFTKRGDRVADEAAALATARHPGVVELIDSNDDVLRTRMIDGRSLASMGPMPADEVAGVAAAVAATLADLHELGVVHGGIDATHVLVTVDGRPLLCSLGRGGHPAEDVAALGRLVTDLLAQAPVEHRGRLRHGRGGRRRRLGPMLAPPAGPAMAALASEAMAPEPSDRPSARALADAIRRRVPAARLPRPAQEPRPVVPVPVTAPVPGAPARPVAQSLGSELPAPGAIGMAADLPPAAGPPPATSGGATAQPPVGRGPMPAGRIRAAPSPPAPAQGRLHRLAGGRGRVAGLSAGESADLLGQHRAPLLRGRRPTGGACFMSATLGRISTPVTQAVSRRTMPAVAGGVAGLLSAAAVVGGLTLAGGWALSRQADSRAERPPTTASGVTGVNRLGAPSAVPAPPAAAAPTAISSTTTTPATTAPVATRVWPAEPLEFKDGVLTYRGSRYAIGHPGDAVVAGDWSCTGTPTLAMLRRDGGVIFAFDGWPSDDRALTARRVGRVEGATDLRVVDADGDGCPELEVSRGGAPPARLRVAS